MSLYNFVVAKHVPEMYNKELLFFALMNKLEPSERLALSEFSGFNEWVLRGLTKDGYLESDNLQ